MTTLASVAELPKHYATSQFLQIYALRSKEIRLRGLQLDPAYFASTFEKESQFPLETWISRLTNPLARTFIAMRERSQDGKTEVKDSLLDQEWLGTLVLLGPKPTKTGPVSASISPWQLFTPTAMVSEVAPPPSSSALAYHLVGVWVAPEVRGSGIGGMMIQAACEAARDEAVKLCATTAVLTVMVEQWNTSGKRLYEKAGFSFVCEEHYQGSTGKRSTALVLQLALV